MLSGFEETFSEYFGEWSEGYSIHDSAPDKCLILSTAKFEDNYFSTYKSRTPSWLWETGSATWRHRRYWSSS